MSLAPLAQPSSVPEIPFDRLLTQGRDLRASYASAQPFPHVVIDDFLPPAILEQVLAEFPGPDAIDWKRFKDGTGRKLATREEAQLGPATRAFLHNLNSSRFLRFLEELTGIDGLLPDPHFEGGGLHQIERGGYLKIHADFNRHEKLKLDRRLNILIYMNKDWREEYGGHLELWSTDMRECVKRVLPVFNRCVVFSTTDNSFHGHPEALTCPEGASRKSVALYYYSNGRPTNELSLSHSTLYQRRPGERFYSLGALTKALFHRVFGSRGPKNESTK
jgi:Rps23 Pro-64 3,4-dihydroxylase Tpa1-like proline 4-hydroxylase